MCQGHEGNTHGTRSRTWRAGSGGSSGFDGEGDGGGGASSSKGGWDGTHEDAEALIGLARQRVGWGVEEEEEGGADGGGGAGGGEGGDGAICVSLPHMLSK